MQIEVIDMKNTFSKNAHLAGPKTWQLGFVCALLLMMTGCGKDSDDGDLRNTVELPVDTELNLYCVDVGIADETCILDDPDNPYARSAIITEDEELIFEILDPAAPGPKARFYLWGTAQATSPRGLYQWFTAVNLHALFSVSGSEIIREQAKRAYRSLFDNYFGSVWFLKVVTPSGDIKFPQNLTDNTGLLLVEPTDPGILGPAQGLVPLYASDILARQDLGEWGYNYDIDNNTVKKNDE